MLKFGAHSAHTSVEIWKIECIHYQRPNEKFDSLLVNKQGKKLAHVKLVVSQKENISLHLDCIQVTN